MRGRLAQLQSTAFTLQGSQVQILYRPPEPYFAVFRKPFRGRLAEPSIDFGACFQSRSAQRAAPRGWPKRGSTQRLLWRQPFSQKGCHHLRFFPVFGRNLASFPSVRPNHSAFVQVWRFAPPETSFQSSVLLSRLARVPVQYLFRASKIVLPSNPAAKKLFEAERKFVCLTFFGEYKVLYT